MTKKTEATKKTREDSKTEKKEKQKETRKKEGDKKPDKRDTIKDIDPEFVQKVKDDLTNQRFLTDDEGMRQHLNGISLSIENAKRSHDEKKLETSQKIIDIEYVARLENATHLHRGTKTEELDNMLKGKTLGHGSHNPNYTYLTTSTKTAEGFAFHYTKDGMWGYTSKGIEAEKDEQVSTTISIPKDKIQDKIVSSGYTTDYEERAEESDIYEPQGFGLLHEEEHRIKPDIVPTSDLQGMEITIFTKDPERRKRFEAKYKSLGKIRFV